MKLIVEADGGSRGNPGRAAFGALVREAPSGRVLAERAAYLGESVTNNVAEYSGLIAGLRAALTLDPEAAVEVRMDSKLVVSQMSGAWKIKNADLGKLAAEARALIGPRAVAFTWVPRERNQAADALANEAMDELSVIERDFPGAAPSAAGRGLGDGLTASGKVKLSMSDAVRLAQAAASGAQRHAGAPGPITTIVLVRHGMSVDTDRDVFAGSAAPGPPLSPAGRLQAEAAGAELSRMVAAPWFGLARPTALASSPSARALETAAALGAAFGLEVEVDHGFVEQDFGLWDGLTKAEVDAKWPGGVAKWASDPAYAPGGGESREQVGARVKAALERVARARLGQTVVIASHAIATRAAIGAALGAPANAWFTFRVAPASINILRLWDLGLTEVVCTNRTAAPPAEIG
ncbi:MAG: bifunctional RNase H/acid phosphatase [Bifidobacteriaceae bacterium]|nr:bifunctional RNase H/acid phosphatase [Bifidobacteriaceae bacterium]